MSESRRSDGSGGSKRAESRSPFQFKASKPDSACYRFVKELHFTPCNECVQVRYAHGTARRSLRKCGSKSKNTERIFTPGDTVDIVWPFASDPNDTAKRNDNWMVWIIVARLRHKTKTMWRRPLGDVLGKLKEYKMVHVWEEVIGHGVLPKGRKLSHSVRCVCVALCGSQKKLWIEEGTFPQQHQLPPQQQQPPMLLPLMPLQWWWPNGCGCMYGNGGSENCGPINIV